jgi:ubiquinone/menaquinone biosynthesis C-methylase UbiE
VNVPRALRFDVVPVLPLLVLLAAPGVFACSAPAAGEGGDPGPGVHPVSGRRIADVMSHRGADWLDRPERVQEEQPHRAVAALALRPGDVVADVGAGTGYYTVRLARAVAPGGQVYATDIQPEMIARLERRLRHERVTGVTPVLATADDPKLPAGTFDLILMVDVYHELAEPQLMLRRLRTALKPGGRLVLVEFRKEDPRVPIRPEHKMSVAEAKLELEAEGYRLQRVIDVLPWQHILVFTPAGP